MDSGGELVRNGPSPNQGNPGLVRNEIQPVLPQNKHVGALSKEVEYKANCSSSISHENIEVKCAEKSLYVVDCTILNLKKFDYYGNSVVKPHVQLSVQIDTNVVDALYRCTVSYFNANGDSVGMEEVEFYYRRLTESNPTHFSAPLNLPVEAEQVVVHFKADRSLQKWCLAVGSLTVACFIFLISLDIKAVVDLFG